MFSSFKTGTWQTVYKEKGDQKIRKLIILFRIKVLKNCIILKPILMWARGKENLEPNNCICLESFQDSFKSLWGKIIACVPYSARNNQGRIMMSLQGNMRNLKVIFVGISSEWPYSDDIPTKPVVGNIWSEKKFVGNSSQIPKKFR